MKKFLHYFLPSNLKALKQGDTVVEVMISMTVLAVVVGSAYAISTRSFQIGLNSQYRDQAVRYSQQQVEILKEADNNSPSTIGTYTTFHPGSQFCIDPSTEAPQLVSSGNCLMNSAYTVSDTYDTTAKSFEVITSWDDAANHAQQSIVFYKPSDSFNGAVAACPTASSTCVPLGTTPPRVTVSASPGTVQVGNTTTINWTNTNVKASSCHANGPGGFSSVNANNSPGTYTTSALTTAGTSTFSVTCADNAGGPVAGSATVTVNGVPPSLRNVHAQKTSPIKELLIADVNPNGTATQMFGYYGTTLSGIQSNTTNNISAGSGRTFSINQRVTANIQPLTTYYYKVCATNAYGTTCSSPGTFN
jgi:Tfp pilus assembly protein PilV